MRAKKGDTHDWDLDIHDPDLFSLTSKNRFVVSKIEACKAGI
jgi:hypothetical protein